MCMHVYAWLRSLDLSAYMCILFTESQFYSEANKYFTIIYVILKLLDLEMKTLLWNSKAICIYILKYNKIYVENSGLIFITTLHKWKYIHICIIDYF